MAERLALEGPKSVGLRAITVNGSVIVESEAERQRRKAERQQKRKSRWDDGSAKKNEKHSVQGMQTIINVANATETQQQIYLLQLQIRDCTQKLQQPNLGIPPHPRDRSPSPEPIYNSKGVRMNTRYERTKAKLTNLRNNAITKLKALDPTYQPPSNYAYKNAQLEDKIDVPQDEYPQYNFMGLLLGPRGHSLEKIKNKYNCKIVVKGRGSVKDGMTGLKKDGTKYDALDESMHVHITGHTAESVRACSDYIRDLIREQIDNPDGERMVALRASHMHELAVLNGTVRDIDIKCLNCGREGHKSWQCPESENVTASIICMLDSLLQENTQKYRMARGGGTGARNKQKKKSDTVISNGTTANGISESEKFAQTKQITKQKKDEESTVATHNDDDATKDEKAAKIQPTSEQLRLAQITQDSHLDPQRKGKISQVIDFTGKTEDEVATALFDCSWDVQKAVELLLEEGGDLGSWEETGKKKKKKQEKDKEDRDDWDDNFEPVNSRQDSDHYRDRSRGGRGGAPRFKRGGGPGLGRQDREGHDSERMEGGRGRGYGRGGMSRGRGGRGPYRERGGRGGSIRGMGGAPPNYMGDRDRGVGLGPDSGPFGQMDTWNPSGDDMNGKTKSSSKDAFDNAGNWGDDFPAAEDWDNDEYTGSLSDTKVFTPSGATSNIKSAVGQPINSGIVGQPAVSVNNGLPGAGSGPTANPSTYGQQIDLAALLQKPGITPVQPGGSSAAPGGPTSINQFNQTATQDLKSAIGIGGPSPASNSSSSVVAAAKDHLSSAAASSFSSSIDYSSGAASSGGAGSGSAGSAVGSVAAASQFSHNPAAGSNFGSSTPGSAFSPIKPASVTNVNPSASKSMPRARLPPPSKIPASAVEMPGDSLANLDVQFGGLDLQFGASNDVSGGSSVGGGSSGFDFRASSLSAASKDLDSSSKYIAITSTDNYTNKSNSVAVNVPGKEVVVNPNLTSAMSVGVSAAMKAVSSSDSYGAASAATSAVAAGGQQRGDSGVVASKPNSNFSTQRSPGPVQSMDRSKPPVAVTDSLGGFSTNTTVGYSGYQVSNQSKQSSNQFGGHSSGGSSTGYPGAVNGYDRQSSSGYSSASYGSGSVSSSFGGGNSQQSGSSQNNGTGSGVNTSNVGYSNNTGSSGVSSSNTSNAFNSGYGNNSYSSYSTKSTNPTGKLENSSGGGSYSSNNFGISSGVSGNKMNMNSSVSSKMLHNLPPGVANMIPQYMMTGAGATFPHYLAAGLQQPAMYGYGAAGAAVGAAGAAGAAPAATQGLQGGVSSQQLEDLAAMQRSTLANLPLVGGSGQAGSQPSSKGPHSGYYDPSSAFGSGQASSVASTRSDAGGASATMSSDSSNKFGGAGSGAAGSAGGIGSVTDNTSSPVPSTVATGQPTPFNALANTFAAAPTQHLPPGYAYFYGGMTPQLQAAYGGTSVYPPHPGIVPTAAGPTATTQFQNKGYGSSYNSYDNLNLGQNNSDYKSNFPSQGAGQTKGTNSTAGHWYNGGIW